MANKMGYRPGEAKGIHKCPICEMPQTRWGASKAQVEACQLYLLNDGQVAAPIEALALEALKALENTICQCQQGALCACAVLGTKCKRCRQRAEWCKCGGEGTCIYCKNPKIQPWMFVINGIAEPGGISKLAQIDRQTAHWNRR